MKTKTFFSRMAWDASQLLRKSFTSLKALTLLFVMVLSVNAAWGADPTVTFTYSDYSGQGTSSTGSKCSATKDVIKIVSSNGYKPSDDHVREYAGTITFSGAKIKKIVLTSTASGTNKYGPSKIENNSGESGSYSYSEYTGTWENNGGDEEVVLKCNAQFRWTQIEVTYVSVKPYTVKFYKADGSLLSEKTESSAGVGVTTPAAQSTTCLDWTFAGWTTDNITEVTSEKPAKLTEANMTFHPSENCNMYPVFTQKTTELVPLTEILDLTKLSTSPYASNDFTIKWGGSFAVGAAAGSCGFKGNSNMTITMPTDAKLTKVSIHNSNAWSSGATVVVYTGTSASGTSCGSMSSTSSGTDQNVSIQTAQQLVGSYYLANTKSANAWVDKVTLSYMGYGDIYFKNPICAPTYAITTNNPANGSIQFSTDGTNWSNSIADQPEDADVYFKLIPEAGFEISGTPTLSTGGNITDMSEGIYGFMMPAAPVIVSATFARPAKYIILYDKGNWESAEGDEPDPEEVTPGTNYQVSDNTLSLTGYTFKGWNTDKNATTGLKNITVNQDITLYAIFTINSYNVTFNPSITGGSIKVNGSSTSPVSVEYNSDVTITVTPTSKYFKLTTLTYNSTDIKDTKSFKMPAENVEVVYSFTEDPKVTVTFKNNGETLTTDGTREVYVNDPIGTLPTLTSADAKDAFSKTFVGWTTAELKTWQDEAPTLVSASTTVTKAIELNAVWAKEEGNGSYTNEYKKITSTADFTDGDYMIVGSYSESYNYALNSDVESTNFLKATSVNIDNNTINNTNNKLIWTATKKSDDETKISLRNVSNNKYLSIEKYTSSNKTYYNLKANSADIKYFTYSVNNGVWKFVSTDYAYQVIYTYYNSSTDEFTTLEASSNPTYPLYLFKRQKNIAYTDYITHSSSSPLESITLNTDNVKKDYFVGEAFTSANLSATAKLKDGIEFPVEHDALIISTPDLTSAGETVTVEYTFNGATKSNTYTVNAYSVTVNPVYTDRVNEESVAGNTYNWTPTTGALTFVKQDHYQFNGITNMVGATLDGEGLSYTLSNPTADVTLTATWQRLFTLTYNGKGGSTPAAVVDKPSGTEITLSTPTWTGYDFVGWYDNEVYEGTALTSPYTITADATIYAKWSEIMPASVSLSPDVTAIELIYDGSASEKAKTIAATVTPSTALDKTFAWSVVEGSDVVEVAADGTITAKAAGTAKVKVASTRVPTIYKEISVTVHALPQITWLNMDGSTYASTNGTSAGKVGSLPANKPTSCDTEKYPYFRGWSATDFGKTTTNPESGFVTKDTEVALDGVYNFYAVCSDKEPTAEGYTITTTLTAGKTYIFGAVKANASATLANNTTFGAVAFSTAYSSTSWGQKVDLKPDANGFIAVTNTSITNACKWTLEKIDNGNHYFKNGSNYVYLDTGTGDKKCGTNTTAQCYLEDVTSICKDAFMLHPSSTSTNVLLYNVSGTGSNNGYRMYASRSYSETMTPYIRFYEYHEAVTTGIEWATQCCQAPKHELAITTTALTVKMGGTLTLETQGGNGATKVWDSSDKSVATVENGIVTPVGTGKATISVSQAANTVDNVDFCEQYAEVEVEVIANNEFGISFTAAEGGSAVAKINDAITQKATTGTTVTIVATESSSDYIFDGWTVVSGGVSLESTTANPTTFEMGSAEVEITPTFYKKTVDNIAIKTAPSVTSYTTRDHLNVTGLVITAIYTKHGSEDIAYAGNEDKFSFSPALDANLTAGNQQDVTVTYDGKSTTFKIDVAQYTTPYYSLVTDASQLVAGKKVVFGTKEADKVMGYYVTDAKNILGVDATYNEQRTGVEVDDVAYTVSGNATDGWHFADAQGRYIYSPAVDGKNYLYAATDKQDKGTWSVSVDETTHVLTMECTGAVGFDRILLSYNSTQQIPSFFSCYSTTQKAVYMYIEDVKPVYVPVTSIELNETAMNVMQSKSGSLVATVGPDNATQHNVTWSIINDNANGKITVTEAGTVLVDEDAAVGATAIVRATTDGTDKDGNHLTAECVITVTELETIDYMLVTTASLLQAGDIIVLGNADNSALNGAIGTGDYFDKVQATYNSAKKTMSSKYAVEITLGGNAINGWTFTTYEGNIFASSSDGVKVSPTKEPSVWTIAIATDGTATIKEVGDNTPIHYNANSPRFKRYTTEKSIQIYSKRDTRYKRTDLVVGNYGTLCVPYAVKAADRSGATFWNIETSNAIGYTNPSSVTIVQEEGDLEAGKPYIFCATETEMAMFFSGDKYEETVSVPANGLYGNLTDDDYIINENANPQPTDEPTRGFFFVLQQKLYECGWNCTVGPNRGWVHATEIEDKTTPSPAPRRVIGNPNGTPTGINNLNTDGWKNIQGARKFFHNNNIVIVNEGRIFNAQGIEVQ